MRAGTGGTLTNPPTGASGATMVGRFASGGSSTTSSPAAAVSIPRGATFAAGVGAGSSVTAPGRPGFLPDFTAPGAFAGARPAILPTHRLPRLSGTPVHQEWSFEQVTAEPFGSGTASLNVGFNQGRWIAEVGEDLLWVYSHGGAEGAPEGTVVLDRTARVSRFTFGSSSVSGRVDFADAGYQASLVAAAPGASSDVMVVFTGERLGDAIPLRYSTLPTPSSATSAHAPTDTIDGLVTERCGYPVGVLNEEGGLAFVTYTLSQRLFDGNSDLDPTRRVRLLRVRASDGAVEDRLVDDDTRTAGFSHSHFPSVAVSRSGGLDHVMVVWRSFVSTDQNREEESAVRGRVYAFASDGSVSSDTGAFDVISENQDDHYAFDPAVIGLADGTFLVACGAQSSKTPERGKVYSRIYTVGGGLEDMVRVEVADDSSEPVATFPHKFPSLATNAAQDRVLTAYEVGVSGAQNPHGTRVSLLRLSGPTEWRNMPLTDDPHSPDGTCDPTAQYSADTVDLVGDRGLALHWTEKANTWEQTINPCVAFTESGEAYVGFALREDFDGNGVGRNDMSLELYAVTIED